MGADPDKLAPSISTYRKRAAEQGKSARVYAFGSLGDIQSEARRTLAQLEEIGVDVLITSVGYTDAASFTKNLDNLLTRID